MSKKLYLECYSGISGDMTVASLLDLGADEEVLNKALHSLGVDGFETKISRVLKSGLDACDFDVILDKKHENHDHDMAYLHGNSHTHNHDCAHSHHDHSHENHSHHHDHEQRGLLDIIQIINNADMTENAKNIAKKIFNILGEAEAKAHGVSKEKVHFHEVGAVDSIVDIVAVAVCLDNLNIEEVVVPVLYEGRGFVRCQHGIIPVPVPAVSFIAANNNLTLHITDSEGEFVTPTGAAIVAAIKTSDKLPKKFSIKKIGIGAGKRQYESPSILRAMIIEEEKNNNNEWVEEDSIYKLESNIDDCTGEALGYVMDCLIEAGARDVHYTPVYMKKNRPAFQLNVICDEDDIAKMEEIIFEGTTTIGIRRQRMERSILKRDIKTIETSLGEVKVKVCNLKGYKRVYPEYNSVVEMCKKHNKSYQEVYHLIVREYDEKF